MLRNFFTNKKINNIVNILKNDGIVILPTDTVYGFFSLAKPENIKRLNQIKKAPEDKKISVMFASREEAFKYINPTTYQESIIDSELPGTRSIVLEANNEKTKKLIGDSETISIRIPSYFDSKNLSKILKKIGPVFSTSVNFHNKKELNDYNEIKKTFNKNVSMIIKHKIKNPLHSTIIDITNDNIRILRQGK